MRRVVFKYAGMPTEDGAGVKLTRLVGTPQVPDLDPMLMLDTFRSDNPNDYVAGFPEHPHRGFETVSYMIRGSIRHRDNHGGGGLVTDGGVQWMTAGRGVAHSEMPAQTGGQMFGFQLWLNLPATDKMRAPWYADIPASAIPVIDLGSGSSAKLIAGAWNGAKGAGPERAIDPFIGAM
jgi:redox-sensitive bicupin YhaK (pirin superfamily)